MAGAKPGVHVVQLKPIVVPQSLLDGAKFVKWDDDSTCGTPVTLRVDKKGFFLYWTDQNKETEVLEISSIRDTRTGKYARVPKDGKLRDTVNMGPIDTALEDKTLTVAYGPDFVNISFINFCCNCREIAKEWMDELLRMAYNLLALNASAMTFLEKAYIRMSLQTDKDGKISVKNIVKIFAQNRDDKRRVEKALELGGYPAGKNEHIVPSKFTFEDFLNFYKHLTQRTEVEKIFEELCSSTGRKKVNYLNAEQLVNFLNYKQRDPRLNEILYPYATNTRAKELILQYEPNKAMAQKGELTFDGFLRYLMSDDNAIMAPEKFDQNADMNQPLSHYFINSSHNTYLTGHQLTGKSSVEMYRQCLLAGCRCIELDCWSGHTSEEEPIITHGYTVVTEISFKEVIDAIAESAFKTSDYPVILSFENHCSAKQQAKMANYCRKVFGDTLQSESLSANPLTSGTPLPSANQLLRKILIKNKKKHHHKAGVVKKHSVASAMEPQQIISSNPEGKTSHHLQKTNSKDSNGEPATAINGDDILTAPNGDIKDSDSSSESEDEDEPLDDKRELSDKEKGTASQESEAGAELSALVNYVQPVHFHGFEVAEKRDKSYEISSFVETAATALLKEGPEEFVKYNKRQLSRIYPKGTRVDSSNYMPQVFWNAGCQLVALNFQTLDLALQLNLGIFEYNGRSGYLLKPDFMRREDRRFDPFSESTVDGIIAGSLDVQIISGQFLSDKRVGTYVEAETYGLPADTFRKRFKTKIVQANGINPIYDEEPFRFKKVVLPELAVIRIAVYEESGKLIGHRILPLVGLRPGYRHLSLRNESGQPLMFATLFVHIRVSDYVPVGLSDLAEQLVNPIKYYSEQEKRAQQLSALYDDDSDEEIVQNEQTQINVSPASKFKTKNMQQVSSKPILSQNNSSENLYRIDLSTSPLGGSSMKRPDSGVKTGSPKTSSPSPFLQQESSVDAPGTSNEFLDTVLLAEPLEKIKEESKLVQNVLSKLEKELQALRKKLDKAVNKEQDLKQQKEEKLIQSPQEKKSSFVKTHSKLLKKLSKTNVEATVSKRQSDAGVDILADQVIKLQDLQRSYCETILGLFKDYYKAELELREKYHDAIHNAVDKAITVAQAAQMKDLQALCENEKSELLKRLDSVRSEEIKKMKKNSRDKNELSRMMREVRQRHVKIAVAEISKLNEIYDKKKKDLDVQHEEIRKQFEDEKDQAQRKSQQDYEHQCEKLLTDGCPIALSTPLEPSCSKDVTML